MYNVGDRIVDDKKDITITNISHKVSNKKKKLIYKYHCNKCGFDCGEHYVNGKYVSEKWVVSSDLDQTYQCACCGNGSKIAVRNINSIAALYPYLTDLFVNREDAYKYKPSSNIKIDLKCSHCGTKKQMQIADLKNRGFSCPVCSKNYSIGERIIYTLLSSFNVEFIKELSKSTFAWCGEKRYDFYIKNINCIVETHGIQHYQEGFKYLGGKSLKEEQQNDKEKYELAIKNNIDNYIVINCSETNFEYIKESILNSDILELLEINKEDINWNEIGRKVFCDNIIKEVCNYWMRNKNCTRQEVADKFHITTTTLISYLKTGTNLGWCDYDGCNSHRVLPYEFDAPNRCKPIKINELNIYIKSCGLCSKLSEQLFGKYFSQSIIIHNVKGNSHNTDGLNYTLSYVTREQFNQAIENGLTVYGSPFIL